MAHLRGSADLDYRTKYERSEKQLQHLKDLSHKAVADYEELQRKYDQNQKQYDELKVRLQDTEYQLKQLQQALEPACEEYNELQELYSIENKCRAEAEKYAITMVQENKKLKRQSQQILDQLNSTADFDLTKLNFDTIEEVSPEVNDEQISQLKEKIEKLEAMLESAHDRCHKLEEESATMREQELILQRQVEQSQRLLKEEEEKVAELQRVIDRCNTLSEQAAKEYEQIKEKHEQEKALRIEAEKYASNMLSQKNAVVRESSIVLASAMSDQRLQEAFMEIEKLQKLVETERTESTEKIKQLESKLAEDNSSKLHDIEKRLEIIIEESEAKSRQIKEMEEWKTKLEKECQELTLKLDSAEQRLVPPPPPPPPPLPSSFFNLFRPVKKKPEEKTKKTEVGGAKRISTFDKALAEMMDRIKKGGTLRATPQGKRISAPGSSSPQTAGSAMSEISQMLGQLKIQRSKSVDEGRKYLTGEEQSDFEKIYNKIKGGTVGVATGKAITDKNLARISEEKDGDLSREHSSSQGLVRKQITRFSNVDK